MRAQLKKVSLSGSMLALGAVALLAAGCTRGQSTCTGSACPPERAKEQVFHGMLSTAGGNDITTLDPNTVTDTSSLEVVNTLYDGLVTLDRNLNVELWGARQIDVSADGLIYVFHLRPGQFFADGTPVLASDYAYSMNRSLNPCVASAVSYYLYPIKDAQTFNFETCRNGQISAAQGQTGPVIQTLIGDSLMPDDGAGTLTITLAQPAAYFLAALTYSASDALEPSVIGSDITSERWTNTLSQGSPTGQGTSGMFYLAHWDHLVGGQLVLKANPRWWGIAAGKKPYLTEIDWTLFKDGASAYAAYKAGYKAGQYDTAFVTPDQVARVQGRQDEHQVPLLAVSAVVMNWAMPAFDNLDARLAFCLAIDRDALNQSVYGNSYLPSWHMVPQGMPGYAPSLIGPGGVSSTHGDPDQARAHWQAYLQTLHGAPVPAIRYYVGVSSQALANALQRQWKAVLGVDVTLVPFVDTYLPPRDFELYPSGWAADYPDPQDFLSNLWLPSSPNNLTHVNVPAANALMQQADANSSVVQRAQQYAEAEQLLINQMAWCPLLQGVEHYEVRSYVHGWLVDAEGLPPNDIWTQTYVTDH